MSEQATDTQASPSADDVLATPRAHEAELRTAGIRHLALFGSVARGDMAPNDNVEFAVVLDPAAHIGLIGLSGLERHVENLIGYRVNLVPEPIRDPHLRAIIERDRIRAF